MGWPGSKWSQTEKHTAFLASLKMKLPLVSGLKASCQDSLSGEKVFNCPSISG